MVVVWSRTEAKGFRADAASYHCRSMVLSSGSCRVSSRNMLQRAAASGIETRISRSSLQQDGQWHDGCNVGKVQHAGHPSRCRGWGVNAPSEQWHTATHLPARRSAGSSALGRLVAATTRMWPGSTRCPLDAGPACTAGIAFNAAAPSRRVSSCPTMRASCCLEVSLRGHNVSICRRRHGRAVVGFLRHCKWQDAVQRQQQARFRCHRLPRLRR